MNIFNKCMFCFILLVLGSSTYLSAIGRYGDPYRGPGRYQYDAQYNRNPYRSPGYPGYSASPYGSYGGYYGGYNYYNSPPPPTPSQAFPDDAAQDALYYELQHR